MHSTLKTPFLMTALAISHTAHAEVVLDGTLGSAGALDGPNFAIEARLGQQRGNNLFHSFDRFNLNQHESATFSGPGTIKHVISRVTGGQASSINGLLRSTIPNADMYFLNPAGVMFGEQARLDVQGSLHVSTADYMRLGLDGRFDASQPERSLLTVAPPSAFGFLDESPAGISKQYSFLAVPNRKTLSFIGGDLTLLDNHLTGRENSTLSAPEGRVNLVSVASSGEVPVTPETIENSTIERFGTITMTDTPTTYENLARGANVDVSGNKGGKVYIRGGRIVMENAYVFADTKGTEDGQSISIKATDEFVAKGARITTVAIKNSTGNGGNLNIEADQITLTDGTQIASSTRHSGAAGDITMTATKTINLSGFFTLFINGKKAEFRTGVLGNTTGTGKGGKIVIAAPNLTLANSSAIRADTKGLGDAGDILLQVDTLTLKEGAQVNLETGSKRVTTAGRGGTLTVTAKEAVLITGQGSALISNTFTAGDGGTIIVSAPLLELQDKGHIETGAGKQSAGKAGDISLNVDTLYIRQEGLISTANWDTGYGGDIDVQAHHISLTGGSKITTSSLGMGDAGDVRMHVKESLRMHNSFIKTETAGESDGGDIHISSPGYLYLINSAITTTVKAKDGDGGNITLKPEFIVLDNSRIKANASLGNGGNIQVTTTGIYNFSGEPIEEVITASSKLGIDGEITIDSPDVNLDDFLVVLPGGFVEAQLEKPCGYKQAKELNLFRVRTQHDGMPMTPMSFME
ncbi:MAG: hypothetical protein DRR19_17925 [Candidatus Parabeggiatoa sp. nov. 1]|nr:MAG: hypothetical protein DRR19_17925 [Gammaproteobacteria bacterium]